MNRANYLRGRALGVVVCGLLTAVSSAVSASAQSVETGSNALDPAVSAVPAASSDLDRELSRAESLFRQGEAALNEGRDADSRTAFDGALDVFTSAQSPGALDPRFLAAYRSMVERITAAEVAAASSRPPVTAPKVEIAPSPASSAPVEPPPSSTLAELGARIEALTPSEEARQTNEAVLGREEIDLPIELNDQVLGAIDLYTGRFNKWFSAALSRGLPHLPRIREILAEAGIPQDLAYVPIVESAFNPSALSRAKAKGLWQFIPSTGKQYGLKQDFFIDERSSVEESDGRRRAVPEEPVRDVR